MPRQLVDVDDCRCHHLWKRPRDLHFLLCCFRHSHRLLQGRWFEFRSLQQRRQLPAQCRQMRYGHPAVCFDLGRCGSCRSHPVVQLFPRPSRDQSTARRRRVVQEWRLARTHLRHLDPLLLLLLLVVVVVYCCRGLLIVVRRLLGHRSCYYHRTLRLSANGCRKFPASAAHHGEQRQATLLQHLGFLHPRFRFHLLRRLR
mmetsp:Transcript_28035/g.78621  ORF Transcript_28035/g.78621 Transcript_28035/m.78621 type:complete len:200 (-) Transcript_28035:3621-4220(-)